MRKIILLGVVFSLLVSACSARPTPTETLPPATVVTEEAAPLVTDSLATSAPLPSATSTQATEPTMEPTPVPPTPTTAAPTSSNNDLVGIHIVDLTLPEQVSQLQNAQAMWTRFDDFHWDEIEPERTDPPTYHWDTVNEQGLVNIQNIGGKAIGMILFSPSWAQKYPGVFCGPIREDAIDRFGTFVKDLVTRYSQPPYNVKVWEVGNEPDIDRNIPDQHSGFGCWGEPDDPYFGGEYYANALKVAYQAVKSVDPQAVVLVGGLLLDCDPVNPPELTQGSGNFKNCIPSKFIEGILKNGGGDYFDGISFHAYDYYYQLGQYGNFNWHSGTNDQIYGPVLKSKLAYLRNVLAQYGASGKLLLNTEVAILCGQDGTEPECQTDEFNRTKAYYVAQANALALAEGLEAQIWYNNLGWRSSGLVDFNLQPLPAYQSFVFSSKQLFGAQFSAEITQFPGVAGYEFTRDGKKVWIVWAKDGQDTPVQLPAAPAAIYDVFGAPLQAAQSLNLTIAPVYIEFAP